MFDCVRLMHTQKCPYKRKTNSHCLLAIFGVCTHNCEAIFGACEEAG